MAPLQPLQQTVFEQGPQAAAVPADMPPLMYQEGQVILPDPINPAAALDPGINWYGLGEQTMKIAQEMVLETWDYWIDTKKNSLADLSFQKKNELNDIYAEMAELETKIRENPLEEVKIDRVGFNEKIKKVEDKWKEGAKDILGEEDYMRWTGEKVDFSSLGRKWQQVALATREGELAVSNQARKIITDLAILDAGNRENRFNFLTETQKTAIRSANNDAEGVINDINLRFNLMLEQLQDNPNAPYDPNAAIKQYGEELGRVRQQWQAKVIEGIGQENFDRLTDPNIDYSKLQRSEQTLALALRESKTDIDKQLTATMLGFSKIRTRQNQREEAVQGFLSNLPMTNEQIRKSVPNRPVLRGNSIIPTNQDGTLPSVFNQPGTNKPLVDNAGNPLYIEVPGTEGNPRYVLNVYPNPNNVGMAQFNIGELPDPVKDTLAILDKPTIVSPNGTNIHPDALEEVTTAVTLSTNSRDIANALPVLKLMTSQQMLPSVLKNRPGMDLEEASRVALAFALVKAGIPYDAAAEVILQEGINAPAVFGILDSLSVASTGAISYKGSGAGQEGYLNMTEDTMMGLQTTVEALYGQFQIPIPEGYFWETSRSKEGSLIFEDEEGGGSAIAWLQSNPNVKFMVARAVAGARAVINAKEQADPNAFKTAEDRAKAFKAAVTEIVAVDAANIGLMLGPNNIVAMSPNSKLVETVMIENRTKAASKAGLTIEEQQERLKDSKQEQWKQITGATLRLNLQSGIAATDNEGAVRTKSLEFIRRFGNGRVDMQAAETLLDRIVEVEANENGKLTSKNISDGILLQIAVASIPSVWSNYGYTGVQGTPYNVSAPSLPKEERAQYAATAFGAIGPAWGWGLNFKTGNIDAIETDNGGFPVAIESIMDRYGNNILPSVANKVTQEIGGYLPTHGDDTPLLMVGKNMDSATKPSLAKAYAEQIKDAHISMKQGKPTFGTPAQLRTSLSPGRKVSTNIEIPLKAAESYTPQPTDLGYTLPADVRDMPIRTFTDLEAILADNSDTLIAIGKNHPVLSQRSAAGNPVTNFAAQLESDEIFSEKNVRAIVDWAKKQTKEDGTPKYKTAGDYLSLLTQLAVIHTDNNAVSGSYDKYDREAAAADMTTEATESTFYDRFAEGYKIKPIATQGNKRGLILWNEQDPEFKDVALDLVNNGFDLVRDKRTNRVFARLPNEPVNLETTDVVYSKTRPITMALPALEDRQIDLRVNEIITPSLAITPSLDTVREVKPTGPVKPVSFRGGSGVPAPPGFNPFKTAYNWVMGNKEEPTKPQPKWETKPSALQQTPTISPGAISEPPPYLPIIKEFERMETTAYWDENGKVWTIGRGNTRYLDGTPVKEGDTITQEQAEALAIRWAEEKVIPSLERKIPTWAEMNKNQKAAIISFAYNAGENFYGLKKYETITRALSKVENFKDVPAALALYKKSGGKVLNGLIRRRKLEAELFMKEPD